MRAPPAPHAGDGQVAADALFKDEATRQLADREAVAGGQRVEPDERRERRVGNVALDAVAAERIGTIEHDHADARPRALPHGKRQRPHEGVVAGPDILEVDDEGVEPGQCLRRRRAPLAVQAPDLEARDLIAGARDRRVILGGAPEPVLGREEPREPHAAEVSEELGRVGQVARDRRLVGEQAQAPPAQPRQVAVQQDLEARLNAHATAW